MMLWTEPHSIQTIPQQLSIAGTQCKRMFQIGDRRMQVADSGRGHGSIPFLLASKYGSSLKSVRTSRSIPMYTFRRIALLFFSVTCALALFSTPAFAQIDLVGEWAPQFHEDNPERLAGPDIGDYAGLPINDAARMMADSRNADFLSVPEHKSKPPPADYSPRGPAGLQIWKEVDPSSRQVIAIRTHIQ